MNRTVSAPAAGLETVSRVLRFWADRAPERPAYIFLPTGDTEQVQVTYAELDRQARAVAATLDEFHIAGRPVLLMYPPGLDFIAAFMGCLYAGVIAVPVYPPPPNNRPMPRTQAILADAGAVLALTNTAILDSMERRFARVPDLAALRWLATDQIAAGTEYGWRERHGTRDTLAFLQYTSGSTATPKGVMVSHENVLYNAHMLQTACGNTEESVHVCWLPIYHDMGLIAHLMQTLFIGSTSVLMPPVAFLQRPVRWLQAISRFQAHASGGPNFAYDLCVAKITDEQKVGLDLSSWVAAGNAAEPIRASTIEAFIAAFEPYGFRREAVVPCYGLAEAIAFGTAVQAGDGPAIQAVQRAALQRDLVVAAGPEDENAQPLVGSGRGWLDERIAIVHPESLTRCPPDRIGEVWLAGPHIAQGYWNRPEDTAYAFGAYLADTGEGPFLRTGDLGFLKDGELFITGRLKDLIIIRGRNYYPQDIEQTVERCHPLLRPGSGAAFSVDIDGEERLVVVQEVERQSWNMDAEQVVKTIRQAIAEEHELETHEIVLIKIGSIHKTSSGKIQRGACRASYLAGTLDVRKSGEYGTLG